MFDLTLRRTAAALGLVCATVAALIIPSPSLDAALQLPSPPVQRRSLPSGLRVIVVEQPQSALAAIDLRVRLGSGAETAATNGTAHFIEHLLFKGTGSRKPGETDKAIEMLGGELTAQTTRDFTRFATVLPAAGWRDTLAVLADITLHPAFRAVDVAAEKPVILSEMAIARTEPRRAGFNALAAVAFAPEDPYRLPLLGTEANVRNMTPEALRRFWESGYRPANLTLVVAGNVRASDVFDEAARLWGQETVPPPAGTDKAPVKASPTAGAAGQKTSVPPAGNSGIVTVFLGLRAPSARDADNMAAVAGLLSLLAGSADRGDGEGWLFDTLVRERRLAFTVTADYVAQRGESLLVVAAAGRAADAAKLEAALRSELQKRCLDRFTDKDAALAQQNLIAAQQSDGTVEGTASRLALADVLALPADEAEDPARYSARLRRVITPEALSRAARQYLAWERSSVVVIGAETAGK